MSRPKNNRNNKQDISIARLEERTSFCAEKMEAVEGKVDVIIENHLPHLEKAITKLDTNQKILLCVLTLMLAGLVGIFFK